MHLLLLTSGANDDLYESDFYLKIRNYPQKKTMNTKNLLTSVGAAITALMLVACATPVGTVYKYKYEGKNLLGTYLLTYLDINDFSNDTYVKFETPTQMEFCFKNKLPAVKSTEGDLKIFTIIPKNNCDSVRFIVMSNGTSYQEVLVGSDWKKKGSNYKVRD